MTQEEQKALVEGQQQADEKAKASDDKADANVEKTGDASANAAAGDGKDQAEQPASGAGLPIQKIWSDFFRIRSIRRSKATGSSPSERALRASKAAAKASAKAAKFAELAKAAADDASRLAAEISKLALESAGGDVKAVEDVKPIAEDAAKQPETVAAK